MTAEIITLAVVRVERCGDGGDAGNGALDVVRDYLERIHPARTMAKMMVDEFELAAALPDGEHFIEWLWDHGFKIEPVRVA